MSFQDEYATTHGSTTLSLDTVASPTIIVDNNNVLGYDTTFVTGVSQYDGLQLVVKAEDGSPACVKPETSKILVERGWGHLP